MLGAVEGAKTAMCVQLLGIVLRCAGDLQGGQDERMLVVPQYVPFRKCKTAIDGMDCLKNIHMKNIHRKHRGHWYLIPFSL